MSAALLTDRIDDVAILTIANPEFRNALTPEIYAAGIEVLENLSSDPQIGAVILTGAGNMFCAGGNLNRLLANRSRPPQVQIESVTALGNLIESIRSCEKPVIAAVEGAAAGAGFALALACDLIVAAHDARFVMAYTKVGLSPDGGSTWLLPRRLPANLAFEAAALAQPLTAERLAQLGVVNRVCEPGSARDAALALANQLAAGPREAVGRIKQLLDAAPQRSLADHLGPERDYFVQSLFESDAAEGIQAFLEKRPPRFGGSR
jgi:enoyl-CoA hydratase/carnithine racemase